MAVAHFGGGRVWGEETVANGRERCGCETDVIPRMVCGLREIMWNTCASDYPAKSLMSGMEGTKAGYGEALDSCVALEPTTIGLVLWPS